MKAANTGIKQLNFTNMTKYTSRNVCNEFFLLSNHLAAYQFPFAQHQSLL